MSTFSLSSLPKDSFEQKFLMCVITAHIHKQNSNEIRTKIIIQYVDDRNEFEVLSILFFFFDVCVWSGMCCMHKITIEDPEQRNTKKEW